MVIAESAADLAKYLISKNIHVKVVHTTALYQGVGADIEPLGEAFKVKSFYSGKNNILRLFGDFIESYRLIKTALKVSKGPIIIMTAPGFLNYWAAKLFKRSKTPWMYWTMDLYPETFAAANLIGYKNPIYKFIEKAAYSYAPKTLIALGRIQAAYLQKAFNKKIPTILLPCGVLYHQPKAAKKTLEMPSWKDDPSKIYFGYVGNLGQAHSYSFVIEFIKKIDPSKHRLILVVYGKNAHYVKHYLRDNQTDGVVLLDYIPREKLSYIDIHLVSLKSQFVNVCVPSKLVSAVHQGSLFLFNGIKACDNWDYLKDAGWIIEEGKNVSKQLDEFLTVLNKETIQDKLNSVRDMPNVMLRDIEKAYDQIADLIKSNSYDYFSSV